MAVVTRSGVFAADNAVLFMWTTSPLLLDCAPVITAWGFRYKAHLIWDKVRGVCGSYVDVRHELLLICTRGSCTPDRLTPAIPSVQTIRKSPIHNQKPDKFRRHQMPSSSTGPRR